jgi:two-component system, OmpR family, aerobic respiration control sensor histidine kinase ArcB
LEESVLAKKDDIEYLKNLTFKLTGDLFSEETSIRAYIDNIVGYFTNLIYSLPNNVYWLDRNCVLRGGNNNLARQLNFKTGADLVGLSYEEMAQAAKLPIKEFEAFRIIEQEVMTTGIPSIDKEEAPIKLGEKTFYYLSSKMPLRNKKGDIVGVVGISTDITTLKETQLNLSAVLKKSEAANQVKTEFIENIRHDIRTPVAGMAGCAQLIQMQANNYKKVTEFASDLVESSDALLSFLNKVLENIKLASDSLPLLKKKFDLCELLEQVICLNKSYAVSKKLKLNLEYDNSIPKYVIGDPIRVQRIVLELVTNALKFTKKGEVSVIVRLKKNEAKVVIVQLSVRDTGIGIPIDKQQEVYIRFKRLMPAYQGIYLGIGLGLSIVKQFVDDLGAEISLQSKLNQGSTFICLIPLQKPLLMHNDKNFEELSFIEGKGLLKTLVTNKSQTELPRSSGDRVLVVEDQALAAKITQHVLTKLHCQVDIAKSGKIALAMLEKQRYDLILMDIGLPDANGEEVTRRIRLKHWRHTASVPIVGLTAHIDAENKCRCLAAGMNAIYIKPLTVQKAVGIVNTFIPHHAKMLPVVVTSKLSIDCFNELPVLDIDKAVQLMGSEAFVKEGLALLVSGLTEELAVIKQCHQEKDWQAIKALAHKWRGGAGYCGTRRLEEACQQLEAYLQTGSLEQVKDFYQQLIQEAEAAKNAAEEYIS